MTPFSGPDSRTFWSLFCKVARLQSEFCTKDFFGATNFLTKNAPKFSPKFSSLCSVGQKKIPGKFPPNFPLNFPNFPAKNQKKNHPRASAGAQGEFFCRPASNPAKFLPNFAQDSPAENQQFTDELLQGCSVDNALRM